MYFNSNNKNNSNKKINNRITYNNMNSYNNYKRQYPNQFNNKPLSYNKQNNNQQAPNGQNFSITGIFLALLLILTSLIMVFHVVNVIDTNNKLKEENSEKKDNKQPDNQIDNNKGNEQEEKPSIEEQNKEELVKLCRYIDTKGNYKYDEYVEYIGGFDANNMTEQEKYEVMSKKNYCQNGICIKIEKDGLINYVDCSNNQYSRMTFKEYEEIKEGQDKVNEALNKACLNVNNEGYFDSGAATGIRVTCDNFVCETEYNDEIITKKCR